MCGYILFVIKVSNAFTFKIRRSELPLWSEMLLKHIKILILVAAVFLVGACSSTRHVPQGKMLLDDVKIVINDSTNINQSDFVNYLRQKPNQKVLGFAKLQLGVYNLSGKDSSRWYNRWLRRLGQAPVVYDSSMTVASERQLTQALVNKGYMDAVVTSDTTMSRDGRKVKVTYTLVPGAPHVIRSMAYEIADTAIAKIIMADSLKFMLRPGNNFDRNALDKERTRLTSRLRNNGYYAFSKEYITFIADTAENSLEVDLTMLVMPPRSRNAVNQIDTAALHSKYVINKVVFIAGSTNATSIASLLNLDSADTVNYKDITVVYPQGDHYIVPSILEEKCFIRPGSNYKAADIDRTYESLAQLGIIRGVNIEMVPVGNIDGIEYINAYIGMTRNKKQGVSFEVEGTNSEGDFGFGVGVTYQHRNLGNRSNLLTTKFRVNYESLSGDLSNLINDRYTEYAGEVGITFPKFMMPFLSSSFKRRIKASSELALSANYQERPEYTRVIAGAAWKYKWNTRDNRIRRTWDFLDINYVYLPESTIDFIDQIAPTNPLLRYSYEDHFIMRMRYRYNRTNRQIANTNLGRYKLQPWVYSLRISAETAGNTLYAISSIFNQKRDEGVYKLFGIQYSQYAKAEIDYSATRNFNDRHALAFHVGAGVAVPYGNSRVLPFEERFYAGGANGVRGWGVRTLGPGAFDSHNSVTDFINQCGDIRFDMSVEYRAKLFWVFEGAAFIDAGNVWTIHNYENQLGGKFRFNSFWKQIALAYGIGLRMDFSYFLLRFDLGMKAHNPAMGQERWPIINPSWKRDASFHFAVGYPF